LRTEELRESGIIVNGFYLSTPETIEVFRGIAAELRPALFLSDLENTT
jgi:hypothetical protein